MAVIEAIETIYLEADAVTSVTTGTIPSTYEHLQVRISLRSLDGVVAGGNYGNFKLRMNGETDTYDMFTMQGGDPLGPDGSTGVSVYKYAGDNYLFSGYAPRSLPADPQDSANYGGFIIDILDYRNTNKNTTTMTLWGHTGTEPSVGFGGGSTRGDLGTDAITTLTFLSNEGWNRGSQFTVYGLNSAN